MFIAVLFAIAKLWNQPRCPSTDERIKKMWYIPTVECYSSITKNEILIFAGNWVELEIIKLSSIRQIEKVKYHIFSLIWTI
jgi:hypothetical protein